MKNIIQNGDPTLRSIAQDVRISEMSSQSFLNILTEMKEALASRKDGVAIAAPQIGIPLKVFIVSGRVFTNKQGDSKAVPSERVFINPEIIKLSKEKKWMEEGCLSVGFHYGEVERSTKATINAYDETGKQFTLGASGLLAQIFQHEVDHLHGVLFIDKARKVQEILPEEPLIDSNTS